MSELNLSRRKILPVIRSVEAAECGLACVAMVASYHGHKVDLNGLRQRYSISLAGASLKSIISISNELGLASRALRVSIDDLRKVSLPAILHWDLSHFVVLKKATKDWVIIHDPNTGSRKLSIEECSNHFTGVMLELARAKSFKKIEIKRPTKLSNLWSGSEGFIRAIIQVLGLSLLFQILVFVAPFYLQLAVDEGVQTGDSQLLYMLAVGFAGVLTLRVVIEALRSWVIHAMGHVLSFQMVGNLVRHLFRLNVEYFEKRHVGDILSRINSVTPIRDAITTGIVSVFIDGIMAIVAAAILFVYSPTLAWIVIGSLSLTLILTFAHYPGQRKRTEEQILAEAKEQTYLVESVRASSTIKMMGREAQREGEWRNLYADVTNAGFSVKKYGIGMTAVQNYITGLQLILVVYFATKFIVDGDGFSVGMLFAFMSYRQTLSDRTLALINQMVQFKYLSLHFDRIGDVVHAKSDLDSDDTSVEFQGDGRIEMRELSFRYGETDPFVLDKVSLTLEPGSFTAVVGPSGGGKTTLLKVLLGMYKPTGGELLLDGKLATSGVMRSWREHVGMVAQDDQLLSGTIAENIAFFDPDMNMARIQEAAQMACVHNDIIRKPMQYMTLVGDMGSTLSGGQRQRVLLARALYRRPQFLFLDEGTANLDVETENQIANIISDLKMTRLVVAHRPALIKKAETLVTVTNGKIEVSDLTSKIAAA